jgi:Icc-related predicted phosphoesterase
MSKRIKITCISDTHQHHNKVIVPKCDILIHAGDFTYHGELKEVNKFIEWYAKQPAKHKILICGNHEKWISKNIHFLRALCLDNNIQLLDNNHITIEGLKFFGSPYSVEFGNWAYGLPDDRLQDIWDCIDTDVDVLITHGPAYKRLDKCPNGNVGSKTLQKHIETKLKQLKLHVVGHIHESRGTMVENGVLTVNAAICGIPYTDVITNPITVEI